jgi:hypothetical protein
MLKDADKARHNGQLQVDWMSRVAPAKEGAVPYGEFCNAFGEE